MRETSHNRISERGFSLLEAVIALGILGVILVAGGAKIRTISNSLAASRKSMSADALESRLRDTFHRAEHIQYSARTFGSQKLRGCVQGTSSCPNGFNEEMPLYFAGQTTKAITGPGVEYTLDGAPCYTQGCGKFRATSRIYIFCNNGATTCNPPSSYSMELTITDTANKVVMRDRVEVEKTVDASQFDGVICPMGSVLRGVGLSGGPICIEQNKVEYADAEIAKAGNFEVKREDCRPVDDRYTEDQIKDFEKAGGKFAIPRFDYDDFYVGSIDKKGTIKCLPKNWK